MKTFEVVLTKSYIIKIKAEDKEKAKEYAELFTGDIKDISTENYRKKLSFKIVNIDCRVNQAFGAKEII
uniref:Uncharacterized protein n=1 Tax=candidate division WOR-3 bacterium TaxID=2052148 RepID=A0A7V0Z6C9_UNCW3